MVASNELQEEYNSKMDELEVRNGEAKELVNNRYSGTRTELKGALYAAAGRFKEAIYKALSSGYETLENGVLTGTGVITTRWNAYGEKNTLDKKLKDDKVVLTLDFAGRAVGEANIIADTEIAPLEEEEKKLLDELAAIREKKSEPIEKAHDLKIAAHELEKEAEYLNRPWYLRPLSLKYYDLNRRVKG